jgi:hypothetical protein
VRQAAGARFDQLELALLIRRVVITDHPSATAEAIATEFRDRAVPGFSAQHVLESAEFLLGSVDSITERLLELRERYGLSYFSVFPENIDAFAPIVARLKGS